MIVTANCPHCGKPYRVSRENLGRRARCGQCGQKFTVQLSEAGTEASPKAYETGQASLLGSDQILVSPSPEQETGQLARQRTEMAVKTLGRYELQRRLGVGGMGEVWLAYDPNLDRNVAIKLLPARLAVSEICRKRFLREARLAGHLNDAHVVRVFEADEEGGHAYIVMEYVEGGSLEGVVSPESPMPWREAARVIRDAASGLEAAHAIGLIHRDVKPANLLRTRKGVTKVGDFGLARAVEDETRLTQLGTVLGTPAYMAPEQWVGEEVDARSDLYALIGTFYHLVTGQPPYDAPSVPALGYFHRNHPFPDPRERVPDLPDAVCRILARGSAKAPGDRYSSCAELIAALDELLARPDEQLGNRYSWESFLVPLGRGNGRAVEPEGSPALPIVRPKHAASLQRRRTPTAKRHPLPRWFPPVAAAGVGVILLGVIGYMLTRPPADVPPPTVSSGKSGQPNPEQGKREPVAPGGTASLVTRLESVADEGMASGRQSGADASPRVPGTPPQVTNMIGMKLVLIPAGEFLMGSPDSEQGRESDEGPQHRVTITKPFYLGMTEVTQEQYEQMMGTNPSAFQGDPNRPVEQVSWDDAVAFCRKLGQQEGENYRLPTEAEWEYACRSGSTARFSFGDDDSELWRYGNYCDQSNTGGHKWQDNTHDDGHDKTAPVGSYAPNAWGLYDMHGNVWEWCADWYGAYASSAVTDSTGPTLGSNRVRRGGCWSLTARYCRSAFRNFSVPSYRDYFLGLRVAREAE